MPDLYLERIGLGDPDCQRQDQSLRGSKGVESLGLSALPELLAGPLEYPHVEASRCILRPPVRREKLLARKRCSGLKCKEHTM